MKSLILIISVVIIVSVSIFVIYAHYENNNFISKQKAIDIAMHGFQCPGIEKSNGIGAQLFHIKNNEVFSVNETTMGEEILSNNYLSNKIQSNGYFWEIIYGCHDPETDSLENSYNIFVDAKSGILLK